MYIDTYLMDNRFMFKKIIPGDESCPAFRSVTTHRPAKEKASNKAI